MKDEKKAETKAWYVYGFPNELRKDLKIAAAEDDTTPHKMLVEFVTEGLAKRARRKMAAMAVR